MAYSNEVKIRSRLKMTSRGVARMALAYLPSVDLSYIPFNPMMQASNVGTSDSEIFLCEPRA